MELDSSVQPSSVAYMKYIEWVVLFILVCGFIVVAYMTINNTIHHFL
jgi:hypothetical protein